jgi:hypothetical protein
MYIEQTSEEIKKDMEFVTLFGHHPTLELSEAMQEDINRLDVRDNVIDLMDGNYHGSYNIKTGWHWE